MKSQFVTFSLIAAILLTACGPEEAQQGPPAAFPVQIGQPLTENLSLTRTFVGRFAPVNRVEIRARVSGYLEQANFEEGSAVKKGDLLLRIDPDLFDAQLTAAQATLAEAEAMETLAKQRSQSAEEMIKDRIISQEDYDARLAEKQRATAARSLATARLKQAELNRSYADIRAPISGIVGRKEITEGNYIAGGTPNAPILTTIVPYDPIYCEFEIDERQVRAFRELYSANNSQTSRPVKIALSGSEEFDLTGEIVFTDNELSDSTATLGVRALVKNSEGRIAPGLFARVQVPMSDQTEFLTLPEAALGFDQARRFVWLVNPDDTVSRRYLEVGELMGQRRIILSGIAAEERIALTGTQLLRPGLPVQAMAPNAPAE